MTLGRADDDAAAPAARAGGPPPRTSPATARPSHHEETPVDPTAITFRQQSATACHRPASRPDGRK